MTYNKPANMTYVEMCIYFDKNIYSKDRNDDILFPYLYQIIYMLACKKRYFTTWEEYDEFALYMASKVYLRYINPKHQEEEARIKSVLNYCKNLLYPTKVDFQKENYLEIFGSDPNKRSDFSTLKEDMAENIQSSHLNHQLLMEDLISEFRAITKLIWKEVNRTPYAGNKIMCRRLFMSILLTLTRGVTLSNAAKNKLKKKDEQHSTSQVHLIDALNVERESSPVVWRLDNTYLDYVALLACKVRKQCGKNIGLIRQAYTLSNDDINVVLASAYGNVLRDDNEEF